MATVALIGPDGAGKTTMARLLEGSGTLRCRYLYMGVDISASNVALPTSRLAEWLKSRSRPVRSPTIPAGSRDGKARTATPPWRRNVRSVLRLTNRIAEECYRQVVSWIYELRGYVVLYDRHFAYDYAPEIDRSKPDSLERRLHRRFLRHLYPQPDLVIFLDAPGAVLFARKGELNVQELERRRQAFLSHGTGLPNFVRVDATNPLDQVYGDVVSHILALRSGGRPAAREEGWVR